MTTESGSQSPLRVRKSDLVWQTVDDEIVVLDLRGSRYFRLNTAGAFLWKLLTNEASHKAQGASRRAGASVRAGSHQRAGRRRWFVEGLRAHSLLEN